MQLLLLTASLALVLTVRCAPRGQDGDQWTEFNGLLGDKVANYTCGRVQVGACSPRGGHCTDHWVIDPRGQECTCSPGYQGSKCDWGPVPPTDYSNGIDWTPERVARVSLALDAATAAYQNQTINGVMGTTVEEQCPSLDQDYHYFHLYNFATMTIEECGGILSCGRETVDTQATFGVVRASAAPSGRTELMIAFRGTEGNAVLTSLQKFQDVTSDLAIGRQQLYINRTVPLAPCTDPSQCEDLGYVHEGFYHSLAPYMDTILIGVTNTIAELNQISTQGQTIEQTSATLSQRWASLELPEITVTGHSLGGGIATICASVIRAVYPGARVHLYTFASPRVGSPRWASIVEGQQQGADFEIARIVNKHDPVSMIPTSLGLGEAVVHIGRQETIDFENIPANCLTWFLDSQYAIISAGVGGLISGCLDIGSHTDYYDHVVPWLRSHGYTGQQRCQKSDSM